ncbi:MAG: cupin domain-containing protein [Bacteroidota bacterium]
MKTANPSSVQFHEIIRELPEADIPFTGVKGWISQGPAHQVAFLEIEPIGRVPQHSHGAQWGIVVEGEMELTIGGHTQTFTNGNSYFIPAGVKHSANFRTKTLAIDFFAESERYPLKK